MFLEWDEYARVLKSLERRDGNGCESDDDSGDLEFQRIVEAIVAHPDVSSGVDRADYTVDSTSGQVSALMLIHSV